MSELVSTLVQLVNVLLRLAGELLGLLLMWSLLVAWVAWWLLGVNWKKAWAVLAEGAWAPLVLVGVAGALAWSQMAPSSCSCLGFVAVPNFWWQLGAVGLLAAATLFCGWLQGVLGWAPAEIDIEPPQPADQGHHH